MSEKLANIEKEWQAARVDLIKRTVCPKGIGPEAFDLFIAQCKRSGLDPLLKECFCVPRRQNVGTKEQPHWVEKHEFQAAEAGMLRRAEEFPDFQGIMASAVYAGDECEVDAGSGMVRHVYRPGPKRGALIGAWVKLQRAERLPLVIWLDVAAYQQNTGTWRQMPATMIEKCARVAALRKAYPAAFTGVYISEELPPDDEERTVAPLSQQMAATGQAPQSRTEELKGRLRQKPALAAKTASVEVEVPQAKPASLIIDVKPGQTEAEAEAAHKATKAPVADSPYARIQELGRKFGKTQEQIRSVIQGATGKTKQSQLDDDDVARVHDALSVLQAQEQAEPPPHGDEDAPV